MDGSYHPMVDSDASKDGIQVTLQTGYHTIMAAYLEIGGYAWVYVRWDAGYGDGGRRDIPWSSLPTLPMLHTVSVRVNGAAAQYACPSGTLDLLQGGTSVAGMPSSIDIPANTCAYVYNAYRTPIIRSTSPDPLKGPTPVLTLDMQWPTGSSLTASDVSIAIGGGNACLSSVVWLCILCSRYLHVMHGTDPRR